MAPSSTHDESADTAADSWVTVPRLVGAGLLLSGLAHLLAPTTLLQLAQRGYSLVLNVEFDPLPGASNRVRAIGLGLIAAGAHLLYYDGILPSSD